MTIKAPLMFHGYMDLVGSLAASFLCSYAPVFYQVSLNSDSIPNARRGEMAPADLVLGKKNAICCSHAMYTSVLIPLTHQQAP